MIKRQVTALLYSEAKKTPSDMLDALAAQRNNSGDRLLAQYIAELRIVGLRT